MFGVNCINRDVSSFANKKKFFYLIISRGEMFKPFSYVEYRKLMTSASISVRANNQL